MQRNRRAEQAHSELERAQEDKVCTQGVENIESLYFSDLQNPLAAFLTCFLQDMFTFTPREIVIFLLLL